MKMLAHGTTRHYDIINIFLMNNQQPPQQNFERANPTGATSSEMAKMQVEVDQKNIDSHTANQKMGHNGVGHAPMKPSAQMMQLQSSEQRPTEKPPTADESQGQIEEKRSEAAGTLQQQDKKKKAKKETNLKCSECLRKCSGKGIVHCKLCPKIFHAQCLNIDSQKVPKKFQCQKCRTALKEKEQKKKVKAAKLHEKIAVKLNTQNKKSQKQLAEFTKKHMGNNQQEKDREVVTIEFTLRHPYYANKNKIIYPVEDDLFDQYPGILTRVGTPQKPQPSQYMNIHFGPLLQLWNCLQTFPEYFEEESQLRVMDLQAIVEYPSNLQFIENLYINLLKFYQKDIFNDRFEMNKYFTGNPFIALLRYCGQNNAFDRIFRFVWVEFLEQLQTLPDFESLFSKHPKLKSIIRELKNKQDQLWLPSNPDSRYELIKSLLDGAVDTTNFHDLLYEKIEQGRQNARQKNQYQETLKTEEQRLNTLKDDIKNEQKELRDKQKVVDQANERQNKPKLEKQLQRVVQNLQKLQEQRDNCMKNIEVCHQNIEYTSNSTTHTSVFLLGQDKQRRSYWFMLDERDKLFVSTPKQQWYYYDYYKINNQLTKCLNTKGVRQKNLYDTLISYKKSNYFLSNEQKPVNKPLDKIFEQEKLYDQKYKEHQESGLFDFDKERFVSFDFIKRMLIEGERKIYAYLEERNARWSTPEDREVYLQGIREAKRNEQIMEAVRHLNEKICVVEIEYKYVVEDENQEATTYDSKTRKIQTKMWGINEKYKHAWLEYGKTVSNLLQLFFLVAVLYLTIERYVRKMRETKKIKKEHEQVRTTKRNKLLNKGDSEGKDVDASQWQQNCHICKKWGDLLCCDMCTKVFHLECVGLTEVPQGEYKCKSCQEKRQTRSKTKKIALLK